MTTYIYGLVDPRDCSIRYIGSTVDMNRRLSQHVKDESSTPKGAWLSELAKAGLQPYQIQLDAVEDDQRFAVEYQWIYLARQRGWALTNTVAMKTEKYLDIAKGVNDRVFVEVDNGLTIRKLYHIIFGLSGFPVDFRLAFFRTSAASIGMLSFVLTYMVLFDFNPVIDLLSVLAVSGALFSIVGLVSMVSFMIDEAKNRSSQTAKTASDDSIAAVAQQRVEDVFNRKFSEIFPDSDVKFKIDKNNRLSRVE